MYTMDELNDKLLSELKAITEELGIKGASKLSKQDLIYKILDEYIKNYIHGFMIKIHQHY